VVGADRRVDRRGPPLSGHDTDSDRCSSQIRAHGTAVSQPGRGDNQDVERDAAETQLRVAALVGVLAVAVAACGSRSPPTRG